MPCDLLDAIDHAALILTWYEHLGEDEMPPRWMWALTDELADHFEWVKEQRQTGTASERDDDQPMVKNEYARGRGRNAR